tara:strand:- start:1216 stop:2712 length:1497 start_codon:yes stop_codon:yes gene_type:complete
MADEKLQFKLTAIDKTRNAFRSVAGGLNKVKTRVFSVQGALTALAGSLALKEFATQIDDLAKQSARLGITVNQLQTLQFAASQSGTGAEELKKGFERFNKSISEASTGVGTGIRAFEALGITLTNQDGSLKSVDSLLNEVADGFTQIKNPADKVRISMDLFGRAGAGMVNMLQDGSQSLNALRGQFNEFTLELTGEQAKAVEEANDRFDLLGRVFASIGQQITATILPALAQFGTFISEHIIQAARGAITAVNGIRSALNELSNFFTGDDLIITPIGQELNAELEKIQKNLRNVEDVAVTVAPATAVIAEGFERQQTAVEKASQKFRDYAKSAQEVEANMAGAAFKGLQSFEDGLVGIVDGSMNAKEAFKQMASSIIKDLIRIFIQKQITGALGGSFGDFFSGGGRAIGGAVQKGTPYTVGERGAEVFVPNQSGSIIPNKDLQGGGVTINQTINITTGVQQTVRAEIAGLLPQIQEASKAAVIDARRRGGNFASAFGS